MQELIIKIAVVAHIRHPIAEPFMGGMESHCHGLVKGLEKRGHDVTLFAAAGSEANTLVPVCAEPCEAIFPWTRPDLRSQLGPYQRAAFEYGWVEIERGKFDVVHNNSLYPELIEWARRDQIAMVTSQHVPPFGKMRDFVCDSFGDDAHQTTVTSHHQMSIWTSDEVSNLNVVNNGVRTDQWRPVSDRSHRLIWFGRICKTKGLRETVAAALRSGQSLDIVGPIEEPEYFDEYVEPYLCENIQYIGHLSGHALQSAVAVSRAAIVTPMWDEPFGLVAAEALASGVPVIAFDRGAMREVVGECGIIVPPADVDALAQAMTNPSLPLSGSCRARAERLFSIDTMIAGYERCYYSAIDANQKKNGDRDCG